MTKYTPDDVSMWIAQKLDCSTEDIYLLQQGTTRPWTGSTLAMLRDASEGGILEFLGTYTQLTAMTKLSLRAAFEAWKGGTVVLLEKYWSENMPIP